MTNIKINNTYEVVTGYKEYEVSEGGEYFAQLFKDGKAWGEIKTTTREHYHEEDIKHIVSEVIEKEIGGRGAEEETVEITGFTYDVWVEINLDNGKLSYGLSTIHNGAEDRYNDTNFDANQAVRKTWKGLENYVDRFINR